MVLRCEPDRDAFLLVDPVLLLDLFEMLDLLFVRLILPGGDRVTQWLLPWSKKRIKTLNIALFVSEEQIEGHRAKLLRCLDISLMFKLIIVLYSIHVLRPSSVCLPESFAVVLLGRQFSLKIWIIDGFETLLLPSLNESLAYAIGIVAGRFLGRVKLEWIALVGDEDLRDLDEVLLGCNMQSCLLAFVVSAVTIDDVFAEDFHELYVIVAAGPGQQALALDEAGLLQVSHWLFLEKPPHCVELLGLHGCEELLRRVRIILLAGGLEGWLQYRDISDCAPVDLYVFDANELKDCHWRIDAAVTSDLAALVAANHAVLLLLDEDVSVLEVDRVEETSKEERKKDVALLLDFHGDLVRLLVLSIHGHGVVICDEHVRLLSLHDLGDAVV